MFGPLVDRPSPLRPDSPEIGEAIAGFWRTWPEIRSGLEKELASGSYGESTGHLTDLVEAIDPGLEWELAPGREAVYALCLSSAFDPGLRPVAERWVRAAPVVGVVWEYHPARISVEPRPVAVGEIGIHPADVTVVIEADDTAEELDLTIGHPDFGRMDETLQLQVVFRLLDDLLGEDDFDRWVGGVDVVPHPLPWGTPFLDLRGEVRRHAEAASGEQWVEEYGEDLDLGEYRLIINRAVKRLDHLEMVFLVSVAVETSGWEDSLVAAAEAAMVSRMGAGGLVFARHVFPRFTVIYGYAAGSVVDALMELEGRRGSGIYEVMAEPDPGWDNYEEIR